MEGDSRVQPVTTGAARDGAANRPVLARQRQAFILERVRQDGGVRVADLVEQLGVSDMTIRRDLGLLHEQGLIEKVHGGAAAIPNSALFEPGFRAKSSLMEAEKAAIADAAVALVEAGTAIGISAGTTTYALARRLVDVPGLTVVTNSIPVADVLHTEGRSDQTVVMTGGVRTPSDALVGPFTEDMIRSLHMDIVFMGVHGMDPRAGFTTPNILEAATDRALALAGRRLVVLADHSKWGVIGISSIARLEEAEMVITDTGLDATGCEQIRAFTRVFAVDVAGSPDERRLALRRFLRGDGALMSASPSAADVTAGMPGTEGGGVSAPSVPGARS